VTSSAGCVQAVFNAEVAEVKHAEDAESVRVACEPSACSFEYFGSFVVYFRCPEHEQGLLAQARRFP